MKDNKKINNDELEKTNVFSDIMSRNEKKKYKKMLKEEKITNTDINVIDKSFDNDINKMKDDKKEKFNKETTQPKKNISLKIFSITTFIISILYLVFSILFCKDQANNLFLIINAAIITTFSFFLTLSFILNKKNGLKIFTTIFLSIFLIFNFLVNSNLIEIPTQELLENFQNKNITEALKWAKENNIKVNQIYEYSDNIEEYHIITQDIYPNTLLKKVEEITFTVSYGPNYEKIVSIPNMVGWDIDSVIKTINENFLNNVTLEYEINEDVKKDIILEQNISGQIRRSDELKLKISLGSESELEPVEMINLKNKSLFEATLWLKRYGIKYDIVYIFSDDIAKNYVVDQETDVSTMVDPKNDTVKLIVSKGKKITIPDLTKMTVDEVTEWIIENNLKVKFDSKYDSSIELGKIIKSDFKENDEVESGTLITITTSKGPLKMPKFNTLTEFRTWANNIGIEYREEYEFNNDINNGDIIKTIPEADAVINYSDTLIVHISYGKPVTIPSFIGQHKYDIGNTCSDLGLNCTFYYNGYSDTPVNIAQNQNKNVGSQVVSGTYVSIGLSSGPAPIYTPPVVETCDKNKTEIVWITPGNDGNQTKANISNAYSNIKWNFTLVDSCSNGDSAAGAVCNANEIDGKNLNHCDTYTVTIVK